MAYDKEKLIVEGRCTDCGKPRGDDGTTRLCRKCADKRAKAKREHRQALLSEGICLDCGQRPAVTKAHCDPCRNQRKRGDLIRGAKYRAKEKGVPFEITKNDLDWPEYCPVFGVRLDYQGGRQYRNPNSPSLDRIIPEKGYVKGNVAIISWRANTLKNNATLEELRKIVDWLDKQTRI